LVDISAELQKIISSTALQMIKEALGIYRPLAPKHPATFHPKLAHSLAILSDTLSHRGRIPEALEAIQESVTLLRPLAKERPAVFSEDLMNGLSKLSRYYSDMGRPGDAQLAQQEADDLGQ
jgi:hypothetical protein